MKTVYAFRGAPASGKGTLVPKFCELLSPPVAVIEQDKLRWGFHLVGRNIPDITDQEHAFAHRNTVLLYERYLQNGSYDIVLEGLFTYDDTSSSQGNVIELKALAKQYDFRFISIVLKADKEALLQRNAARTYSVPKDEFNALFDSVYGTIGSTELVIDSTSQTVEETLAALQAEINSAL